MKIKHKHITPPMRAGLESLLFDGSLYFYYVFLTYIDFYEAEFQGSEPRTMCVGLNGLKLALFYDSDFVASLGAKEMKAALIHEVSHLLHDHCERGKGYHPVKSNLAQDMIINHLIVTHHKDETAIPKLTQEALDKMIADCEAKGLPINPDKLAKARQNIGTSQWVELDPNYRGDLVFEPLYKWMEVEWEKEKQSKPNALSERTKDLLWDVEQNGMTFDGHGELSEVEQDIKNQVAQELLQKAKMKAKERGFMHQGIDELLGMILKKPKDNKMKMLKRVIAAMKGLEKRKSYRRMNIRGIEGMKGAVKESTEFNALWDTSGSMMGEHETVISQIFRDGYVINLIQIDTQVNKVQKVRSKAELLKLTLTSCGGTTLTPGIQYILDPKNKLSKYPTLILTDGATDTLDFHHSTNQFLILTTGSPCPVMNCGSNVKQIVLTK